MLKKEIKKSLYYLGVFAVFFIVIMVVNMMFSDYKELNMSLFEKSYPEIQILFLFFASLMGITMFSDEISSGSMEYVLSHPYSRLKLLMLKLLPRLGLVFVLYLILLISSISNINYLFSFSLFTILYFSLFFISVGFSLFSKSFVSSFLSFFVFSVINFAVYYYLIIVCFLIKGANYNEVMKYFSFDDIFYFISKPWFVLLSVFFFLALFLSFFISFRNFDSKPLFVFNLKQFKKYALMFIVFAVVFVLFVTISLKPYYSFIYKDTNGNELKYSVFDRSYKIGDMEYKLDKSIYMVVSEDNKYLYALSFDDDYNGEILLRINKNNGDLKELYETNGSLTIHYRTLNYKEHIYIFEKSFGKSDKNDYVRNLIKIDKENGTVKKYDISKLLNKFKIKDMRFVNAFYKDNVEYVVFTVKSFSNDCKLCVIGSNSYFKAFDVDDFYMYFFKDKYIYANKYFVKIFNFDEAMNFVLLKEFKNDINAFIPYYYFAKPDELRQYDYIVLYTGRNTNKDIVKQFYALDMENLELKKIEDFKKSGMIRNLGPDKFVFVEFKTEKNEQKLSGVYKITKSGVKLIKKFDNPIIVDRILFNNSIIYLQNGKYHRINL